MRTRHPELIREIKEKNDIVAVVSEYVTLRRAGRSLVGLCPFHSEKTPSFNVNPAKQFFYCFGCGAGGDVISFLMKAESLDFLEAARRLAERVGVAWPENETGDAEDRRKELLFKINKLTAVYYHHCLWKTESGERAGEYLQQRGIAAETRERFYLGYAPPGWRNLTEVFRQKGVDLETADLLGLVGFGENGYYDRLRERLVFPIFDLRGNICGFGGRVFDNSRPKYLNTQETALFHKSRTLYGLHLAKEAIRKKGYVIIVEGYMDVIQAHQGGGVNTVASLGTAFTVDHAKLVKRYANEVVLAYDADTAGQNATVKGLEVLRETGLNVRVLTMPEGDDPDSFIKKYGFTEFDRLVEKALNLLDFKIRLAQRSYDLNTPEGKAAVIREILPQLAGLQSSVSREDYIRRLSREIGVSEAAIFEELKKWVKNEREKTHFLDNGNNNSYTIGTAQNNSPAVGLIKFEELTPFQKAVFKAEKELLQFALQEYEKFERIKEELNPDELYFEIWRELYGELLNKPPSGADWGKFLEELEASQREVAVALMAESQIKDYRMDLEKILNRLKMLHLQEKIQNITNQIAIGKDQSGAVFTEAALKEKIREFTTLKNKLQREYPNFTGEI